MKKEKILADQMLEGLVGWGQVKKKVGRPQKKVGGRVRLSTTISLATNRLLSERAEKDCLSVGEVIDIWGKGCI